MYLPKHFRADDAQAQELLEGIDAADLITPTSQGLWSTFLPLLHDSGRLLGHVARANEHWRLAPTGESLVIVHGPDGYISPSWYATKAETGRVVPTWNYLIAHVHGTLIIHEEPAWLEDLVRRLTARHEQPRRTPWSVDDAPRDYTEAQLRAIVGVELVITRIEAKAKLGLQRPEADVQGVINGLGERGDSALAAATERARHTAEGEAPG